MITLGELNVIAMGWRALTRYTTVRSRRIRARFLDVGSDKLYTCNRCMPDPLMKLGWLQKEIIRIRGAGIDACPPE